MVAPGQPLPSLSEYLRSVAPGTLLATFLERLEEHGALALEVAELGAADSAAAGLTGYELLGEIHRGGQGVVYRAIQLSTKRQVAVKLLLDAGFASARRQRRFEREVELVATLDHPGIARVYDSSVTADGRPFFAMEYIDGVPADGRLRREGSGNEASTQELVTLFVKICRAVHYAHQRGVLHRDLKPGNILVDANGDPHVLDFGIAVTADDDVVGEAARLTRTGEFMGTLAYASPEQVSGVPTSIDLRSDVYSLGVLLYELLTGALPYPVDGPALEVVRAIQERAPRPPTAVRRRITRGGATTSLALAGVDRELDTIALQALAKEKERRYQSAGELADDLERYLAGRPILARGESTWYVLRKTIARHKLTAAALAVTFAALVTATIVSNVALQRAQAEARRASVQNDKAREMVRRLQDVFFSIAPDQAKGRSVTVRETLDDAARTLDESQFASPEAELELRRTVGQTYQALRLPRQALPHLERAEELATEIHGPRGEDRLQILVARGQVLRELSRFDEAEEHIRRALELLAQHDAPDVELRGFASACLGQVLTTKGQLEAAATWFDRAQEDMAAAFGADSVPVANLLRLRSNLLYRRGDLEAAKRVLARAADVFERSGDPEVAGAVNVEYQLGHVEASCGNFGHAVEHLTRAATLGERLFGTEHESTYLARSELALARLGHEGYELVAAEYERLVEQRGALDPLTSVAGDALNNIGVLAMHAADYELAEEILRESLERYEAVYAEDSFEQNVARANLGWCLLRLGRDADAERLCTAAVETVRRLMGEGSLYEGEFRLQLAWTHLAQSAFLDAVEESRRALEIYRGLPGDHELRIARATMQVGLFLSVVGDGKGAEEALLAAERIHEAAPGRDPVARARTQVLLGTVYRDLGRLDLARPRLELGHELSRRYLAPMHPDLAEAINALGVLRFYGGDTGPAVRAMFLEAIEIMRARGERNPRTPFALGNLGGFEAALGNNEAAAEHLDEAIRLGRLSGSDENPLFSHVLASRGSIHERMDEMEAAVSYLEEAYELITSIPGSTHPTTDTILYMLISACKQAGDEERALRYGALFEGDS